MQKFFYKYILLLVLILIGFEYCSSAQDSLKLKPHSTVDTLQFNSKKTVANVDSLKNDSVKAKKSAGIDAPVSYSSSDSIRFFVKKREIFLFGDGQIDYEDITLKSNNVQLDMNKHEVYARGKMDSLKNYRGRPNFKQGDEIIDSDTLKYNFDSKKGLVYGLVTKQEEGYLHSQKTKVLPSKEVNVKSGKFTTCDLEEPHFYIAMTRAKVIPNDKIVTGPAYLVIEGVAIPVVIPFGFFPNKKGRASGILIPTFGNDQNRGFYFKNAGFYFGVGENMDIKLLGDIYTLGSWRASTESNYIKKYKFRGNFNFTYASLIDNEVKQRPTFSILWSHSQDSKASKNGTFNANVNYQSSGFAKRNAQSMDQYLSPSISSSISYNRSFLKVAHITVSALHNQNLTDSTISLTIPNVSMSASSLTPFKRKNAVGKTQWYEDIRVGYSMEAQNRLPKTKLDSTFYSKATLNSIQKGIKHSIPISTSIKLLKYFTLTPSINLTDRMATNKIMQSWDDSLIVKGQKKKGGIKYDTISKGLFNVWDYSLSLGVNTNLFGMYVFKNKVLKALRHKVTPSVSYVYTPDFGNSKYGYYDSYLDKYKQTQYYSYYAGSVYGTPNKGKQSSLNFSLSNSLELKVRNRKDTVTYSRKISLIDNFSVSAGYNFMADSLKWSLITMSGTTNLFKRLSVRYSGTLDPYALDSNRKGKAIIRTNNFMYDNYGRMWRLTNDVWDISTTLQLGPAAKDKKPSKISTAKVPYYSNFSMPWNMNLTYSISLPRTVVYNYNNTIDSIAKKVVQSLSVTGSVNITKNWKIGYATGWDFINNKITYTKLDFYRNLHCWDMSFLWIPFGGMQRYEFTLKVRAAMLQDLKMDKKKTYGNVVY